MTRRRSQRSDDLYAEAERLIGRVRPEVAALERDVFDLGAEIGVDFELDDEGVHVRDEPVLVRATSENRKLAPVVMDDVGMARRRPRAVGPFCSSTFVPVAQTCPSTCPFRGNGCMAESGYTGRPNRRIERNARGLSSEQVSRHEARAIDRELFPRGVPRDGGRDGRSPRDLRLHVSGDVTTRAGLRAIAAAVERWKARGGGSCWTFTHAWRDLPRKLWGAISVLASVEEPRDAEVARARGYVPAITVRSFPAPRAFRVEGSSTLWLPCPAELGRTTCVECRLCLDRTTWLGETSRGIAFAVHGQSAEVAKRKLPVLRSAG